MLRCNITKPGHVELEDCYQELGVTQQASDTEVKAAWRRLSARWHPDRNPSPQALQRIQRINLALEEIRRAREGSSPGDAPEGGGPGHDEDDDAHEHTVCVSLEEAASGCIRVVHGEVARCCAACAGSGAASAPVACTQCEGRGSVPPSLWFSWLTTPVRCDACEGHGSRTPPCAGCAGTGRAEPLAYRASLRIPAGVRDGHALRARVKLKGQARHQVLDVRVRVLAHEFMSLQQDGTIRMEVPVDGFAWIAGRWIEVPTPYGMRQMRLQRGALTYRMRAAGFPAAPGEARADCLVTVVPLFPAQWTPGQEALLDALVDTNTGDAGSDAGARAHAWQRMVAGWQEHQPGSAQD
jgi:DnaJ-class molecular chaperone